MSQHTRCRQFAGSLIGLLALQFLLGAAIAEEVPGIDTYGFAHIDAHNAGLFSVPIPSETYDPLSGKIGHRMNDMVISGNGPLPIVVHRKYEELPKAFPHAFGNMSLVVPHLIIDVQTDAAHDDMLTELPLLCGNWKQAPGGEGQATNGASWNDIKFHHPGGMVSLIDRDYIKDSSLSNYPDTALYISKDN